MPQRSSSARASLAAAALLLLAGAARAKTLVVCDDVQDPVTLDPHKEFSEKNHTLLQQIFEGLVRFDPQGRIEPALAVSWERIGPLRVRFHLRRGVAFQDGEPFDAEAVRFTIARYLDPATGFPARGYLSSIDRAEEIDPATVDIVTKYPDGLLLNRLAGFVLIVPPRYVKKNGEQALARAPVGTGAFAFESWKKGDSITLVKNRRYWDPRRPKVDRLVFRFLPPARQMAALRSGKVDIVTELPGTETMEAVRNHIRVLKMPSFYAVAGSFNAGRKPLSDLRVRQAINLAVNRAELVRYDLRGNGRVVPTVTMEGEEGHAADLQPYAYDPAQARRLLAQAGYPDGFRLKVAAKVQGERAAKIIAAQLAKVKVFLDLRFFTDAELIGALSREPWDMFLAGCPDPMADSFFIQSIFLYSRSPYRVAVDAPYDRLLDEMVGVLDDAARRKRAEALDHYIHDQALLLFLYQRIKTYGLGPGVSFTPWITGMPYFFDADVKESDHG